MELNTGCNLLKNSNLDTGWSKGYNKNIKWNDGPKPDSVTDPGAKVVSFNDANSDGAGYWYRCVKPPNIAVFLLVCASKPLNVTVFSLVSASKPLNIAVFLLVCASKPLNAAVFLLVCGE